MSNKYADYINKNDISVNVTNENSIKVYFGKILIPNNDISRIKLLMDKIGSVLETGNEYYKPTHKSLLNFFEESDFCEINNKINVFKYDSYMHYCYDNNPHWLYYYASDISKIFSEITTKYFDTLKHVKESLFKPISSEIKNCLSGLDFLCKLYSSSEDRNQNPNNISVIDNNISPYNFNIQHDFSIDLDNLNNILLDTFNDLSNNLNNIINTDK